MNYQKAADVQKLLGDKNQPILSKRGSAVVDARTNTLFVQDVPSRLEDVRKLLAKIDVPVRQVVIEARIVIADDSFSKSLGARLGYNSARYLHTVYQTMSLAFADRDFYYGDPDFAPTEPIRGLLSKEYAKARAASIGFERNDTTIKPGDPYPYQGETNPFADLLRAWPPKPDPARRAPSGDDAAAWDEAFYAGTTSIQAADSAGWVVSVTPSGGWVPAVIAGRTGVGLSQRMQSFVLDARENPFNVIEPGKRPRVTLTPSLALKDGLPWMAFSVQGGDSQDQNLLQFFLNVVEFGMTPQQAAEAPNMNSFQMRNSFNDHSSQPGRMLVQEQTPPWVRQELGRMGYTLQFSERTSGPITAIWFDRVHGTMWGAVSNHGEDYGIAW